MQFLLITAAVWPQLSKTRRKPAGSHADRSIDHASGNFWLVSTWARWKPPGKKNVTPQQPPAPKVKNPLALSGTAAGNCAVHGGPHRQRSALPRLRHSRCGRRLRFEEIAYLLVRQAATVAELAGYKGEAEIAARRARGRAMLRWSNCRRRRILWM